jgi:hypothetical protein
MTITLDGNAGMTAPAGAVYNGLQTTTAQTASGTAVDFTGIPLWATRITVMFNDVSTNGSSYVQVQVGSGSIVTTGYSSSSTGIDSASAASSTYSSGFVIGGGTVLGAAGTIRQGAIVLTNINNNTWVATGVIGLSNAAGTGLVGGSIALSGTLDRVRITTIGGTNTFDAGTFNIIYE